MKTPHVQPSATSFVSKLQAPRIVRPLRQQRMIQLRPAVDDLVSSTAETDDEDQDQDEDQEPETSDSHGHEEMNKDDKTKNLKISPLSPTLLESSSCSSLSSPVSGNKRYIRKEKIGQGAQGAVYRCIEVATGREVAVKVIMTHELSEAELEAIKREVKTMKRLHHRHLVEYFRATERKRKQLSIYMEYVAGGSLGARVRKCGALPLSVVQQYTRQLCQALQHLHRNRIAHRDIKGANVFLTTDREEIKLGDFGAFKEIGSVSLVAGIKGTPHWMAPEVIREQQTSEDGWLKADIWSLGCVVIEMLTGHSPWRQYSNPMTAMYQIVSSEKIPTIPEDATTETTSFLHRCLQRNPDERATVTQLLAHEFLQQQLPQQKNSNGRDVQDTHKFIDSAAASSPDCRRKEGESRKTITTTTTTVTTKADADTDAPLAEHVCDNNHQHIDERVEDSERGPRPIAAASSERRRRRSPRSNAEPPAAPVPSPLRTRALRQPTSITRLQPLDATSIPSSCNQERDQHHEQERAQRKARLPPASSENRHWATQPEQGPPLARGASTSVIRQLPRLEKTASTSRTASSSLSPSESPAGISIARLRLRRLSTAPAATTLVDDDALSRDAVHAPHLIKLPPLSARPSTSSTPL